MPTASEPEQLRLFELGERRSEPPSEQPQEEAASLLRNLQRHFGGRLRSLMLTDNRSRILSAKAAAAEDPQGLHLRLHRCFLTAPEEVLAAVAGFASGTRGGARRQALARIRAHFEARPGAGEPGGIPGSTAPRRRLVLRPVGRTLDLRQVCDELNQRFFEGRLEVHITWGRAPAGSACRRGRGRRRSIRLGSFHADDGVIRIHRALDRPGVPRYVVEAIVYHELLHAALPPRIEGGRRRLHTPELRRRERLFPHHRQAERWLKKNLPKLLGG